MSFATFLGRAGLALTVALVVVSWSTGAQAWTESILHSFAGGSDGALPESNLIADQNGNLYGTTEWGGGGTCGKKGCGTVFEIAPHGRETVLHAFSNMDDGANPVAGLVQDGQGNLYGTTELGGSTKKCCGTVFKIAPDGTHTIIYAFKGGVDGGQPVAGLVFDASGNLYGTTTFGGAYDYGTVFEVTPDGSHTVLYSSGEGRYPNSTLVFDTGGNLYGTTLVGGSTNSRCSATNGCGTVFKLGPDGTETIVHAFKAGHDGNDPLGGLMIDASGNLYGTTALGGGTGCGGRGCGIAFELVPDGTESILSRFNRSGGPNKPGGGLIMDQQGNLFGTTFLGGSANCGTVFKIAPGRQAKSIYSFACGNDGRYPAAALLQDGQGNLYGTTTSGGSGYGTVFALKK